MKNLDELFEEEPLIDAEKLGVSDKRLSAIKR